MRFLFTVQGEGRGHYTQALSLAAILRKQGHEVVAVLVGGLAEQVEQARRRGWLGCGRRGSGGGHPGVLPHKVELGMVDECTVRVNSGQEKSEGKVKRCLTGEERGVQWGRVRRTRDRLTGALIG